MKSRLVSTAVALAVASGGLFAASAPLSAHTGPNGTPFLHADVAAASTTGRASIVLAATDVASDPDDDALRFASVADPAGGSAVIGFGATTVLYTPDASTPGSTDTFAFRIVDSHGATVDGSVAVTVAAPESTLRVFGGGSRTVVAGQSITLGGAGFDLSGQDVAFSWTPTDELTNANTATPTFSPAASGAFQFQMTGCTDGCANAAPIDVNVIDANPSVAVGPGLTVSDSALVELPLSLTLPDGAVGPYTLDVEWGDGAETIVVESTDSTITHQYTSQMASGPFDVVVCATTGDGGDLGCSATEMVFADAAPTVSILSTTEGSEIDGPAGLVVAAGDADGDTLTPFVSFDTAQLDAGASCKAVWTADLERFDVRCNDDGPVGVTIAMVSRTTGFASASTTVTIGGWAPQVEIAPVTGAMVGVPVELAMTLVDATNDVVSCASIDWGDGTTDATCSASHTFAAPGAYAVVVRVTDDDGASSTSRVNVAVATNPSHLPGAPTVTDVTAVAAGRLRVTFSPPVFAGTSPITSYSVVCANSVSGALTPAVSGAASPINVSGLTPGDSYACRVAATNASGAGAQSDAFAPVMVPLRPGVPTGLRAAATTVGRQLRVQLTAPGMSGGAPVTSYTITCSTLTAGAFDRSALVRVPAGTNPTTVAGLVGNLTPGASYKCFAVATTMAGVSADSAFSNTVTIPNVPGKPSITTVWGSVVPRQARVWVNVPSSNGGSRITKFVVTCTSAARGASTRTGTLVVPTGSTAARYQVIVDGLTRRAVYRCTAVAHNISGASPASAVSPAFAR